MIASMTGYGKADAPFGDLPVAVEVRSVNHRFCEVVTRLPKLLVGAEPRFRRVVQHRVARGRVDVVVSLGGEHQTKRLAVDAELARQYYDALKALQRELGLPGEITLQLLTSVRDILTLVDRDTDAVQLADHVEHLIGRALDELEAMRRVEGEAIGRDFTARLRDVTRVLEAVASRAPDIVREYAARLRQRIGVLAEGVPLDADRLAQEVAIQAERCDYTEEVTRLRSHLSQCEGLLKSGGPVGRTLDFLMQEINREINTIGSKANDAPVAQSVVVIKSELEKLREQVQNIE